MEALISRPETADKIGSQTVIVPTTSNRLGESRYQKLIDRLLKSGFSASMFILPDNELSEHPSNSESRALEDLKSNISAAVLAQLFIDDESLPVSCSKFDCDDGKLDIHLEELKLDCLIPISPDTPAWAAEEMGIRFFAIAHVNADGKPERLSALVKRPLWKSNLRTPNCPFGRSDSYFSWRATAKGLPTVIGSEGTKSAEVACLMSINDAASVVLPISDQESISTSVYWRYIHESEAHL